MPTPRPSARPAVYPPPSHPAMLVRRAAFYALVVAQDSGLPVGEARAEVRRRFGLTDGEVLAVEQEGLFANWPPL